MDTFLVCRKLQQHHHFSFSFLSLFFWRTGTCCTAQDTLHMIGARIVDDASESQLEFGGHFVNGEALIK